MLELNNATLTLHGRQLVKELSVMALGGQLTVVTGPAGCGKTALLLAMMGFLPLDSGYVSIDGCLLTPRSATTFRRTMAYLPQQEPPAQYHQLPPTADMETVFAGCTTGSGTPRPSPQTGSLMAVDNLNPLAELSSKTIVIADDPSPSLLPLLNNAAHDGRVVVVASNSDQFLRQADRIVTLA